MKISISNNEHFKAELKLEKMVTKFSNSSHAILPKNCAGCKAIIFIIKKRGLK